MKDNPTRFGAIQYYSKHMKPYFNPMVVVGQVLIQMDLNPNIIKYLSVRFFQEEDDFDTNAVRVDIDLNFPMSAEWIEHMKQNLTNYLQDGFSKSYGVSSEPWFSEFEKEAPFFLKGTPYEGK
jgi:hypothetical protein